jgi:hypothetical protein
MKKFISNLLLDLRIIFCPAYWINTGSVNRAWDKKVQKMLENPRFEYMSRARIKLNGNLIWVENYPYRYGEKLIEQEWLWQETNALPSRKTRIRLKKAVDKFLEEYAIEQ